VRSDDGEIVYRQLTSLLTPSGSVDVGLLSCNILDGRFVSAFLIDSTEIGFSGVYDVTYDTLVTLGIIAGSRASRRAAIVNPQVINPIVCLTLGQIVLFSVSKEHYPVFDRNNLLNSQTVCLFLFYLF
jgi:hypothetical protein